MLKLQKNKIYESFSKVQFCLLRSLEKIARNQRLEFQLEQTGKCQRIELKFFEKIISKKIIIFI